MNPEPPPPEPPPFLAPSGHPRFHAESGRIGLVGAFAIAVAAFGAALIGGLLYGPINWMMPVLQLSVLLPFALGGLVGCVGAKVARVGHVRNRLALAAVVALACVFADYVGFISWIYFVVSQKFCVYMPGDVQKVLGFILEKGVWSMDKNSSPVSGRLLLLFWIAELVCVVGTGVAIAWSAMGNQVYCERCRRWYDTPLIRYLAPRHEMYALFDLLPTGDLRPLFALPLARSGPHVKVDLRRCGGCKQDDYLSVTWRKPVNVNGRDQWQDKVLLDKQAISPEAAGALFERS